MKAVYLDKFTTLDEVPNKQQGDARVVLRAIMAAGGRFSVFDATANQRIASTMTWIERTSGWVKRVEPDCGYPWVVVELTDAGRVALG